MTTNKAKRQYKESAHWDDMVDTTTFQFEQLCNFMAFGGYPVYNKHFTFVSKCAFSSQRYIRLDRAVGLFNKSKQDFKIIEKVRLEKHKDGSGGYYLSSFDKVKFCPKFWDSSHLAEIVLKN